FTRRINACLLVTFSSLMRRAYSASFPFQDQIGIILEGFFTASAFRRGGGFAFSTGRITELESKGDPSKTEMGGHPEKSMPFLSHDVKQARSLDMRIH
ncbi:MAG: hypothetical protein WCA19_15505, partial [Candidatus Acidiferrales bacterium]